MKPKSGEIYFVRETVLGSNDVSSFVKIGLVADRDGRDSADRLLEHQTGNPRRLFNQEVIKTPAVHRVEALMHRLYAPIRVSGEWFNFADETGVNEAINKVKSLAKEMSQYEPIFEKAEELAKVESKDGVIPVTPKIEGIVSRWSIAKTKLSICDDIDDAITSMFVQAIAAGADTKGAVESKTITPEPKFSVTAFRKDHKELAASFDEYVDDWKQTFKATIDLVSTEALDGEFLDQLATIESLVAKVAKVEDSYLLNEPKLLLLNLASLAQWDFDLADAELRLEVGDHEGIEGVCTWSRKMGKKAVFNKGRFAEEQPDLWLEYTLSKESFSRLVVSRKKI